MRGSPNTSPAVDGAVDPDLSAASMIHVPHLSECYPDRRTANKTAEADRAAWCLVWRAITTSSPRWFQPKA